MNPVFRDDETGGSRYAAEQLASSLLSRSCISPDDLLRLSLALPSEVPARGVDISGSRSVSLGAFACSKLPGLLVRDTSKQHPLSTRVFSRFVRGLCPDFTCTTIAVFTNLKTDLHQDTANDPASQNLLYPLTAFSEGGVWCEDPAGSTPFVHQGQTLWGRVLEVSQGLCFLPAPNRRHATLPWKGDRAVLVCYTAKETADIPPETRSFLEALDFPLPPATQSVPKTLPLASPTSQTNPDPSGPLFVELFAGCARLSRFCQAAGFRVLPVDAPWNPHKPEHPVLVLDLTEPACQQQLLARLLEEAPFAVHVALPCGTGSRARERPISKKARLQGAPEPRPLRDAEHVLGLPGLSEKDQIRVDKSNELCRFVVFLLQQLPSSCHLSIENPENSWIWAVLAYFVRNSKCPLLLKRWSSMQDVCFSNCMKGGRRPKRTRFRCSHALLQSLEADCDGMHEHLPYLVYRCNGSWSFSTAQEAEYPAGLCYEMASLLSAAAGLPGRLDPPAGPRPLWPQQKGTRKLLPEFLEFSATPPLDRPFKEFTSDLEGSSGRFGVYRTPQEFVQCALELDHPFDVQHCVPDAVKRNIFRRLTEGPTAFASERVQMFQKLNQLEKELRYEEARLHSVLPEHVREVVKDKNLLLWAHLLEETLFADKGVFELMKGVDLVGKPDKSPLFDVKEVPATSDGNLLLESASWRRERLKGRDPHKDDAAARQKLWDCTIKDRDNGFLKGPFASENEVREHLGVDEFVCSRRFLIEQGTPERPKARPIDNYKEGGVNEAYHCLEKLALFDVNWMTAISTYIARVSDPSSPLEVELSCGEVLRGEIHPQWKSRPPRWLGRTLDLEKAYRQVPLSCDSLKFGVVMVTEPSTGQHRYFVAQSLPFGATSSVFAFNRLSRSILHLSWHLLGLVSGCFYDDFPLLEVDTSAKLSSESFEHMLRKLGWKYSTEPEKSLPFEETFDLLGIRLNAGGIADGVVSLHNKPSRLDRMKDALLRMSLSGKWDIHSIQSLQGQVNFAVGFASGRGLKLLQRALGSFLRDPGMRTVSDLRSLCSFGVDLIDACTPRIFACRGPVSPVVIFTDAAYEHGIASYGVVVIDRFTDTRLVAGGRIPDSLVRFWRLDSPEQVIGQAEAFAVVAARQSFSRLLTGRRAIYFVDNEGAREVLIKGGSRSRTMLLLASIFFELENEDQGVTWLERVPSQSNIADPPSRGLVTETAALIKGRETALSIESLCAKCMATVQIPWELLK